MKPRAQEREQNRPGAPMLPPQHHSSLRAPGQIWTIQSGVHLFWKRLSKDSVANIFNDLLNYSYFFLQPWCYSQATAATWDVYTSCSFLSQHILKCRSLSAESIFPKRNAYKLEISNTWLKGARAWLPSRAVFWAAGTGPWDGCGPLAGFCCPWGPGGSCMPPWGGRSQRALGRPLLTLWAWRPPQFLGGPSIDPWGGGPCMLGGDLLRTSHLLRAMSQQSTWRMRSSHLLRRVTQHHPLGSRTLVLSGTWSDPAFLLDSIPSEVPETQDLGSLETLARLASREDGEVLAFLLGPGGPRIPWSTRRSLRAQGPGDQVALGGPCDLVGQGGPWGPIWPWGPALTLGPRCPWGPRGPWGPGCLCISGAHACPEAFGNPWGGPWGPCGPMNPCGPHPPWCSGGPCGPICPCGPGGLNCPCGPGGPIWAMFIDSCWDGWGCWKPWGIWRHWPCPGKGWGPRRGVPDEGGGWICSACFCASLSILSC